MNKSNFEEKANPCGVVSNGRCNLYCGDCLKVMDYLISKDVKVNAIITDPPYG